MKKAALAIACVCTLIVLMVTNSTLFVQATGYPYNIVVKVSSPTQNETYLTNDVPLSFSYDTDITASPDIAEYSVVFTYNLDGQPNFSVFGSPIFSGETKRIGQFYQPVPLAYNSSIHVPDGNHSLFVLVTFWITPDEEYAHTFNVYSVSQVVNFTVYAGTPSLSPTPTISPEPTPTPEPNLSIDPNFSLYTGLALLITILVVFAVFLAYRRKHKH